MRVLVAEDEPVEGALQGLDALLPQPLQRPCALLLRHLLLLQACEPLGGLLLGLPHLGLQLLDARAQLLQLQGGAGLLLLDVRGGAGGLRVGDATAKAHLRLRSLGEHHCEDEPFHPPKAVHRKTGRHREAGGLPPWAPGSSGRPLITG